MRPITKKDAEEMSAHGQHRAPVKSSISQIYTGDSQQIKNHIHTQSCLTEKN